MTGGWQGWSTSHNVPTFEQECWHFVITYKVLEPVPQIAGIFSFNCKQSYEISNIPIVPQT
jgi:hypothetical protein